MQSPQTPALHRAAPAAAGPLLSRLITQALVHPWTMKLKRPVRDLLWVVKGRTIRNPELPKSATSLMFLCTGNICRSPFAESLVRRQLAARGRADVRCASAGLRASQPEAPPDAACAVAEAYGLSLSGHRSQGVTRELLQSYDVIVVMDAPQLSRMRDAYPDLANRVFLLSLFDAEPAGAHDRFNIADPFGKPRETFEACYARLDRTLIRLLDALGIAPTENNAVREQRTGRAR